MVLKALQAVMVEQQLEAYLQHQQPCPRCARARGGKGSHCLSLRTLFGNIPIRSPRLRHCVCQAQATKSFSPLADLLPEHTLPELLFLETKWAALMSYVSGPPAPG